MAGLDSIELWDVATGKHVPFERTHRISPNSAQARSSCLNLAFLPDGKHLLAAYDDGTGLVWRMPNATQQPPALNMTESTWDDLASLDARIGHQAVWAMRNEPAKAIELLSKKLKPATMPAAKVLAALIEQLAAHNITNDKKRRNNCAAIGPVIEPFVHDSLRRTSDPEQKRRPECDLNGFGSVATRTPEEISLHALYRSAGTNEGSASEAIARQAGEGRTVGRFDARGQTGARAKTSFREIEK